MLELKFDVSLVLKRRRPNYDLYSVDGIGPHFEIITVGHGISDGEFFELLLLFCEPNLSNECRYIRIGDSLKASNNPTITGRHAADEESRRASWPRGVPSHAPE